MSAASHEHVVELIRNSGALVSMTVVSLSSNGKKLSIILYQEIPTMQKMLDKTGCEKA